MQADMEQLVSEFSFAPTDDNAVSMSDDDEGESGIPQQTISYGAMLKLNEMRVNNQLCDSTIRLEEGSTFNIHRAILSASSSYFRALFTSPFSQNKGTFDIKGISPKAMENVIRFIYMRDISFIDESTVYEMYVAADFLSVLSLVKKCVDFLIETLSPANCVDVWLFGKFRLHSRLVDESLNYILGNFVEVSASNEQMLSLNDELLFSIINDDLLNVKDESVVWEFVLRWIDCDCESRLQHLPKLMSGVRLGLLSNSYFMENVKDHRYVKNNDELRPILSETIRYLCDLEEKPNGIETVMPSFALPRLPNEILFAIGGWSGGTALACFETYDTRADRWLLVPANCEDPMGPRSYHGTAVIGSKLYIIGGFDGQTQFDTCFRYDVVKKKWNEIARMGHKRCYVSVVVLEGKIYALGGYDGTSRLETAECYCPKTNQWTMIAQMNYKRSDADACTLDGKIFITGGFNGQECLSSAEVYDPQTNRWNVISRMESRRSGVSCVSFGSCIYVVGGFNGLVRMNSAEKYDTKTMQWTPIADMYCPRSNFGLEVIDGMIVAVGGFNGMVTTANCEIYQPELNEWKEACNMTINRSALTATTVKGISNVREYLHQDRHMTIENKSIRVFDNSESIESMHFELESMNESDFEEEL